MKSKTLSEKLNTLILTLVLASAAVFLPALFSPAFAEETSAPQPIDGELIVVMEDSAKQPADNIVNQLDQEVGVKNAETITDQTAEDGESLLVTVENPKDTEKAVRELEDMPGVLMVQPNYRYGLLETGRMEPMAANPFKDSLSSDQYYIQEWDPTFSGYCGVNAIGAWKKMRRKATVTIAVMDTGCSTGHGDLSSNVLKSLAYNSVTGKTGASAVGDSIGHGTHVAGIAGAVCGNGIGISGVSGNSARILPIKVFDGDYTTSKELLKAFSYLRNLMDAGKLPNLHVINMSLGGYAKPGGMNTVDSAVAREITAMRARNVICVCAGGNGNWSTAAYTSTMFPGDYKDSFCVTALDDNGANLPFSDYNKAKDISAPGMDILSTVPGGFSYGTGSSMAAPVVSGIAAMIWADCPTLTASQVIQAMQNTARPVNTSRYNRGSRTGSKGAVDADRALTYARRLTAAKRSISKASVKLSTVYPEYTGKAVRPKVTVRYGSSTLVLNRDYKLSYKNNVKDGTAYAVITGAGAWTGTRRAVFHIIRPKPAGTLFKVGKNTYVVTLRKPKASQVSLKRADGPRSASVPATVSYGRITYKVTGISPKAFAKKRKLKTVTVKTPYLTAKSVKKAFSKSKVKKIYVKIGTKAVNKSYIKRYKRIFTKKNCGRKVKLK